MGKQYSKRNLMELDVNGYYIKHVMAMTAEELHSKSDIAAELAFRDEEIDKFKSLTKESGRIIEELCLCYNHPLPEATMGRIRLAGE